MSETVSVSIQKGTISKGDNKGKEWKGLRITIGEWSTLIFSGKDSPVKTKFEMDYIEKTLEEDV